MTLVAFDSKQESSIYARGKEIWLLSWLDMAQLLPKTVYDRSASFQIRSKLVQRNMEGDVFLSI